MINNGIDATIFYPLNDSAINNNYNPENKFIILAIASFWSPQKGLNDFIKLSRILDSDYRIMLVGLNALQRINLPSNIICIDRTENVQKPVVLYSNADVSINPSVEETFGLTTVEALACGTLAIVFIATASMELIIPDTGFIVEKGDIPGLFEPIQKIKTKGKKVLAYSAGNGQ